MNKAYWAGHILQFDPRPSPSYNAAAGTRLLVLFVLMEIVLGPRLAVPTWLGLPIPEAAVRVPALLLLALVLMRSFSGISLTRFGLYPWKNWSDTERWYFVQTIILVNVVFAMLLLPKLKVVAAEPELWSTALRVFVVQLLWGFYQELI